MNKTVGLALSGGGSRAIAFHLGCLRALNKRKLLNEVSVISAVSGGAVIAAMYAYSADSFDKFDSRVIEVLERGIQKDIAIKFLLSGRLIESIGTALISGTLALGAQGLRTLLVSGNSFLKKETAKPPTWIQNIQPPLLRWVSRTNAFEDVLKARFFGNKKLTAPTRNNLNVVLNATELRTGNAFRYSNQVSSCWKFGKIENNDVEVAAAVAASAAYPLLLPALHKLYDFVGKDGDVKKHKVVITDGGVYDNSGVTCLEPGRNPNFTEHAYSCDHIISCNAGYGQFSGSDIPYGVLARLRKSFATSSRKLQDATTQRLLMYRNNKSLKALILPYLGQQDSNLIRNLGDNIFPSNFVKRSDVVDYPTDFAAMPKKDIQQITLRAEQLTNILLNAYWPD
ncbi:MAG: patatin-like phospholipase family protein [Cyanobacteria bacterium P01_B01_bin.77]